MPFQKLKTYILQQVGKKDKTEVCDFRNTFSEVTEHETTQNNGVIFLMALAPCVIPRFYDENI